MKNRELIEISVDDWIQQLFEMHIDPDFWCDLVPEDYGFKLKEELC